MLLKKFQRIALKKQQNFPRIALALYSLRFFRQSGGKLKNRHNALRHFLNAEPSISFYFRVETEEKFTTEERI